MEKKLKGMNLVMFILAMMAGWVDTVGIAAFLNGESGFMTGRIHTLALYLFNRDLPTFLLVSLIIISFMIGAYFSGKVTRKSGLKGGLILTGILIIIASLPVSWSYVSIVFLPMAMGSQNAATSLTPMSRTTHLSGVTTDLGINIEKRNWYKVISGLSTFIGFPLGALIGYNLSATVAVNPFTRFIVMLVPAIIVILTGIIQEKKIDIPLVD